MKKNVENTELILLHPYVEYEFHCTGFYGIHTYLTSLLGTFYVEFPARSDNKYGKQGRNSFTPF
jgi:hypothetical protein